MKVLRNGRHRAAREAKKCDSDSKCWKTSTKNKDGGAIQFVSFWFVAISRQILRRLIGLEVVHCAGYGNLAAC